MNKILLDVSTIYRSINKYLDRNLKEYNIGAGQFLFLLKINENEGQIMSELTDSGDFDKATITKTITKLQQLGYITIISDQKDKRKKRIYSTNKFSNIINNLYEIRKNCIDSLLDDIQYQDIDNLLNKLANNSKSILDYIQQDSLKIANFEKLSLNTIFGSLASTIYTTGCNFKCPHCNYKDLVYLKPSQKLYPQQEIVNHIKKNKTKIKTLIITGGEPTIQPTLIDFIKQIKQYKIKIKLLTNGYNPEILKKLLKLNLIDSITMEIKNTKEKYNITTGINPDIFNYNNITKSINIIKNSNIDYEFKTIIVTQFHNLQDIIKISKQIKNTNRYILQPYNNTNQDNNLTPPNKEQLQEMLEHANMYVNTIIQGV